MKLHILLCLVFFSYSICGQIVEFSDEFEKTCDVQQWLNIEETEGWGNTHIEAYGKNESNSGRLTIMPYSTAWFASRRSNLLYKEIAGDFVFTSEVTALNRIGDDQPGGAYSLAGIMVRQPKLITNNGPIGDENYVFLSLGSASTEFTPQFEIKNTINNSSSLIVSNIDSTTAQIRMVRVDGAIVVLYRLPGESWEIRNRYNRSDLADTLQVGFVTYSDWNKVNTYSIAFHNENTLNSNLNPDPSSNPELSFNADIVGSFEYGRFTEPNISESYVGLDFWDSSQVPNSAILDMFGFDSESTSLTGWKIWNGINSDWNDSNNWQDGTIPSAQDSIVIPNCNCPEIVFPLINSNITCASLEIDEGGVLNISQNISFTIDLNGNNSRFINQGTITNAGSLLINNASGKQMINLGTLECTSDAECLFLD